MQAVGCLYAHRGGTAVEGIPEQKQKEQALSDEEIVTLAPDRRADSSSLRVGARY